MTTSALRSDPNSGFDSLALTLTVAQLEKLKALALRDHNGQVSVQSFQDDKGLSWVEVTTLLVDMGDAPLHTFYLSPKGVLRGADDAF